jgi:short-subunit dehydrogenase
MAEWKGKTALITGASYGLGVSFAQALAAQGANLVLTARSEERLRALASELEGKHAISTHVIGADLGQRETPQLIFDETARRGLNVDLLINNAGFGLVGRFMELPLERQLEMIQLNVTSLVHLTHLFLKPMLVRRAGAIVQVASTAAFQPVPYFSVYSATKAFVLSFGEALWLECEEAGVRVISLCPGPTDTNFQQVAGTTRQNSNEKMQPAEEVVEECLAALEKGEGHVVAGVPNKLMVLGERLVPRKMITRLAGRRYRHYVK